MFFICFFKQKTAYEMRISDWSSDVCSSDLDSFGSKGRKYPSPIATKTETAIPITSTFIGLSTFPFYAAPPPAGCICPAVLLRRLFLLILQVERDQREQGRWHRDPGKPADRTSVGEGKGVTAR